MASSLIENLRLKHVLLDTNFLMEASRCPEAFSDIFQTMTQSCCKPITISVIEFEFLQRAFQDEHRRTLRAFMAGLNVSLVPLNPVDAMMTDALKIANVYAARGLKSPGIADACIAAVAKK